MPHRVLQIVAGLITLAAVSAFAMGIAHAPQRGGRLPGAKAGSGVAAPATAIEAPDATPLSNERIEGPPPPTPEEEAQAKADAEAQANAEEADAGNADSDEDVGAAASAPPTPPPVLRPRPPPTPTDTTGQTLGGPAAADEPPH